MSSYSLTTARLSAIIFGFIVIVLETVRRYEQLLDPGSFLLWFDDYIMGAFLIFSGWKAGKSVLEGQRYLTAAWGLAVGAMFMSFRGQIGRAIDPAPVITSEVVMVVKGVLFLFSVLCLILSLRKVSPEVAQS